MYRTLLFDLDGTLTNPKEGITKCIQYALSYFGVEESDRDKLTRFIGPPLLESFQDYYGFDEEKAQMAVAKYRERFAPTGIFENELYDGIVDLMAELKKNGYITALATSKPEGFARTILEHFGLAQYFDVIVGSSMDHTRNTKTAVIKEVLRILNYEEDDLKTTVMIGDRKHDIIGAKNCGLDSIGVYYGFASPGELEAAGASLTVETVEELRRTLL